MHQSALALQRWYALSGPQAIRERWVAALQAHVGVFSRIWKAGVAYDDIDAWICDHIIAEEAMIPDVRVALIVAHGKRDTFVWERNLTGLADWRRHRRSALARLRGGQRWRVILIHHGIALRHALLTPPCA